MEHNRRHKIIWALGTPVIKQIVRIKFNFRTGRQRLDGSFILLCNHVTDWDPLLVSAAFRTQMYFVASEHIFRLGWVSRLLYWLVAPIARQKGGSAAGTVKAIMRTVKEGQNVALFPEGNRTWDGVTRPFPASTGKLVRSCGCTLVTYRLRGGYFSSPRWAGKRTHRGRMSGELMGVYPPEQLRAMTVSQINDLIARDIYEDAYATQTAENVAYNHEALAEDLETLLFVCPVCGKMHTLRSAGDRFRCESCGMETRFTPTGYFEGGGLPFTTVKEWNAWQEEQLREYIAAHREGLVFSDDGIELTEVQSGRGGTVLGTGELRLYGDRMELPGGISVPLGEITGMSMQGAMKLFLSTDDHHFQLLPAQTRCMLKYLTACGLLGASVGFGI